MRVRDRRGCSVFLFLLLALPVVIARQAEFSWLQQHVDGVKRVQLVSEPQPRLYMASAANAVAALELDGGGGGTLLWSKVQAEVAAISHLRVAGSRVFTLSDDGRQLSAWDADTGAAVWAAAPANDSGAAPASAAVDLAVAGSAVVVALGVMAKASRCCCLSAFRHQAHAGRRPCWCAVGDIALHAARVPLLPACRPLRSQTAAYCGLPAFPGTTTSPGRCCLCGQLAEKFLRRHCSPGEPPRRQPPAAATLHPPAAAATLHPPDLRSACA